MCNNSGSTTGLADTQTTSAPLTSTSDPTWTVVAAIVVFVLGSMLGSVIAVVIFKFRSSKAHKLCFRRPQVARQEWYPMVDTPPGLQFVDHGVDDARSTAVMVPR